MTRLILTTATVLMFGFVLLSCGDELQSESGDEMYSESYCNTFEEARKDCESFHKQLPASCGEDEYAVCAGGPLQLLGDVSYCAKCSPYN